ncbi:hypothetical protein AVEN_141705-1 [Araneus ventricosus]|uniref:Uncharacterized protein n=1 Tax=Araneus ventricosus TaxID=182803 RepID=A0A4Y2JS34_ARAVE|nr:hypothetical protein AVEN_141705-1 [Araneus ventricosus]
MTIAATAWILRSDFKRPSPAAAQPLLHEADACHYGRRISTAANIVFPSRNENPLTYPTASHRSTRDESRWESFTEYIIPLFRTSRLRRPA